MIDILAQRKRRPDRLGIARYAIRRVTQTAEHEFRLPHSRTDYDCSRFRRACGFVPQQSLGSILWQFLAE